jgi:hypothetical protein
MVLVFYAYQTTRAPETRTPGSDSLDAKDLIEEIIAIQTAKLHTPGSTGDSSAMDPDSVRNLYELFELGEHTLALNVLGAPSLMHASPAEELFGNQPCQLLTHYRQPRATQ